LATLLSLPLRQDFAPDLVRVVDAFVQHMLWDDVLFIEREDLDLSLAGVLVHGEANDVVALRLCMDRIYPPRKDRPVTFPLPPITSARDAADIMGAVAEAVAAGSITPSDGAEYAKLVDAYVKAYHAAELDDRVARVEQLTDAELLRIAVGRRAPTPVPSRLLSDGR
jgi:hypothetical protein